MDYAVFRPSPFAMPSSNQAVTVVSHGDAYAATRQALVGVELQKASGARVLVKPNAGRVTVPGSGVDTAPRVVEAVIDALLEAGALVSVGDSPIAGVGPREALETSGIAAVARARGVPLLDLDERPPVPVPVPQGIALSKLKVCADVLEHDLIVSVPVMKTHMHTGVTLSIKNMKGCLWRRSKVALHMLPAVDGHADKSLDIAIADLASILRPHLAVIDGTVGMEGLGPSAGQAKRLNAVVVGVDGFAADAVACFLMGRESSSIPHLRMGAERGLGCIDLEQIPVTPSDWARLACPFAEPPRDLALSFPNVRVMDQNSCSACQSTLLLFLKRYGDTLCEYFPNNPNPSIAIGKGHVTVEPGTVCLGNCTAPHRQTGVFIPGCPPVVSAIHTLLTRGPIKDDDRR